MLFLQNRPIKNFLVFLTLLVHLLISSTFLTCQLPAQAVVPTTNSTSTATGDGVTNTFTFTFELLQASDMTVYVNSVLQTYNVAYTVQPTGGSYPCTGGTITFQSTYTPANNAAVLMARQLTLTQTIALPVEGALPSSTLQTVFDRATMQIQQLSTNLGLAITLPITEIGSVNTTLPAPMALDLIGWDNTGTNIVNYTPAQVAAAATAQGVFGPSTSTIGHVASFNNTTGNLVQDTGIASSSLITTSNLPAITPLTQERAYLVSGSPYTDGSSSGNTTLYVGPLPTGNKITWDNGSGVLTTTALTEISLSLASLVATDAYDIYLYNNSGTWTLEADQWSNSTTPLATSTDAAGRRAKSGSTNKLLVAQVYCATSTKLYNYTASRHINNLYNKISNTPLFAQDTTGNWSGTAAIEASHSNTTDGVGRVSLFVGTDPMPISYSSGQSAGPAAGNVVLCGTGIDSTSAFTTCAYVSAAAADNWYPVTSYSGNLTTGFHYIQRLDNCPVATTLYGGAVSTGLTNYLAGEITL